MTYKVIPASQILKIVPTSEVKLGIAEVCLTETFTDSFNSESTAGDPLPVEGKISPVTIEGKEYYTLEQVNQLKTVLGNAMQWLGWVKPYQLDLLKSKSIDLVSLDNLTR